MIDNSKQDQMDVNVDIDLTKLTSTMVYSEVYDMMSTPENYIGKTVKTKGMFMKYTNADESMFYPAVIIADATARCSRGIEFLLKGNPTCPDVIMNQNVKLQLSVHSKHIKRMDIYM